MVFVRHYDMPIMEEGEDKVIGGFLTLRQAAYLLLGLLFGLLFRQVAGASGFVFPVLASAALAFARVPGEDAGLDRYLSLLLKHLVSPRAFPWRRGRDPSAQSFLGIEDVKDGVIRLPGRRYAGALEVLSSVNFALLSEEEQDQVEAWWRSLLWSLSFPVQVCVQTRYLDMSEEASEVERASSDLPETLRRYAIGHASYLRSLSGSVLVRRVFVVLTVEGISDPEAARRELLQRKGLVSQELSKWLAVRDLSTADLVDVLSTFYQKERASRMRPSDADEFGFTELVVRGVPWGAKKGGAGGGSL